MSATHPPSMPSAMTNPAPRTADPEAASLAEMLSSLADGELGADDIGRGCRLWHEDDSLRRTWHAYHLIADVMRSDQLSSAPSRDAAFLRAVRGRLAAEPRVLAPRRLLAGRAAGRWVATAAVVGGVAVVVTVLGAIRVAPPTDGAGVVAVSTPPSASGMQRVGAAAGAASGQVLVIDGNVIRDARLDAYFDAHRGAAGMLPSAVPGGALRSVEMIVPAKR